VNMLAAKWTVWMCELARDVNKEPHPFIIGCLYCVISSYCTINPCDACPIACGSPSHFCNMCSSEIPRFEFRDLLACCIVLIPHKFM
jgi:hypothetical protein